MHTVGIKMGIQVSDNLVGQLKQSLLLFDKIGIVNLNLTGPFSESVPIQQNFDITAFRKFLQSLELEGYLFNIPFESLIKQVKTANVNILTADVIKASSDMQAAYDTADKQLILDTMARCFALIRNAIVLDNNYNVPIISTLKKPVSKNTMKADIVNLIIQQIPVPDYSTPWERIVEFKSDLDNKGKFAGLKTWMNKAVSTDVSILEVKDELDYLLYQYRRSLELHKIKYHTTTLQRVVVGTAELIENAARLKLSKIANGLFSAHQEKVELLEAELTATGHELAYIYQAQKTFG